MPIASNIDPQSLFEDLLPLESCKKLFVIVLVNRLLIQNVVNRKMSDLLDHCRYPNRHRTLF